MHDLAPLHALGGHSPQIDVYDRVTLAENADFAYVSIAAHAGGKDKLSKIAGKVIGVTLPLPEQMTHHDDISAIWTGPDQWMVEAPIESHETMADDLTIKLAGIAAVTEQNDSFVRFDLTGELCVNILERLCAVNSRQMPYNSATRTAIEHISCFILHRSVGYFSILGARSSAKSLHHNLINSIKSVV
ncbi:sarcosine oxidase subunit gamma [Candidatus Puniceispirillum marinum]|uniref:Sarcosine oxidase, gamma subunit n=1 Tax=Puniceispirillum marinum (strain IMCC1322) TaxID=488538 RepID=D5BPK1_PUNMI|nr:sarcosine oxidase subunit gamma [Candidatus Puniceispirillum marinum]ADE38483.1 sarcosine oxidase, gamma subunit [Candidatus Puniceispirillum marinum IMCC1322]